METNMNTFGTIFVLKKQKAKQGKYPIYLRITMNGRRSEVSIKRYVREENWNLSRGLAKGKSEEVRILNTFLEQIRRNIVDCYQELKTSKQTFSCEDVKNAFLGIKEESHTLIELFDYHNKEMNNLLEWGTLKNYFTTKKYFQQYLKAKHKKTDIHLSLLRYGFLVGFVNFMKETKPINPHQPFTHNTIMKHVERFKKIMNLAYQNEWLEKDPFKRFKLSFIKKDIEHLTEIELNKIEKKKFKIERLECIKDLFVFSCYTGLSYIDVHHLKEENIIIGIDGRKWISTNRKKTDKAVMIPILPQAMKIIDKYKNYTTTISKGKLLPSYSNQRLNSYLKEIADICRIKKNLTFHMARHTFATTVTLSNGIPIETVSKLLGHSNIKTTQIYARVIESKISSDMDVLYEKLNNHSSNGIKLKSS
ncbi:MAG: site-specific integrase [Carboxylicivirga sp.]|jgi:integrase|nr:site-specific integrase [Carboxylicivirga sp.]